MTTDFKYPLSHSLSLSLPLFLSVSFFHSLSHSLPPPAGRIEAIEFHGGIAGASSEYPGLSASKGFKEVEGARWASCVKAFPAFIWYDFQNRQIRLVNVSFEGGPYPKQTPIKFQFIGTNDECTTESQWSVLCEMDDPELPSRGFGGCQVGDSSHKYRCLGLKILASEKNIRASVKGIKMYLHKR